MFRDCLVRAVRSMGLMVVIGAVGIGPARGALFSDDFNDGNASGWTTYNPLGVGTFSFPGGNAYRLQAGQAPNFPNFGPGRAGAFRNDLNMTQFEISVDMLDWQENNQFFGIMARARQIGAGTLDAYLLSYSPQWYSNVPRCRLAIDRLDNEGTRTELVEWRFNPLDPAHQFRLVFSGNGSQLSAKIYDLADLGTQLNPLMTTIDSTYTTGVPGLFVAGSFISNITSDATFDNFSASVPEPCNSLLLLIGAISLTRKRPR